MFLSNLVGNRDKMRIMRRFGDLEGGIRKLVLGSRRRNIKVDNWRIRSEVV